MSMDIDVFVDDIRNASKTDCESYMQQFGIMAQIHPESNFETDSGFLPMKVEFPSVGFLKGKTFLSGFECASSAYDYECEIRVIKEALSKKSGGLFGFFKKKADVTADEPEIYIKSRDTDALLKQCRHTVTLYLGSGDSFEPILALAFALYLVENCNGVMCYSFSDECFDSSNKREVSDQIGEFFDELTPENLVCHPFEKWR